MLSSCVTARVYKDLESRYDELRQERLALADENAQLNGENKRLSNALARVEQSLEGAVTERDRLRQDYAAVSDHLQELKEAFDALEQRSSSALAENARRNRSLLEDLEQRERALDQKMAELERLKKEMAYQSARVAELEGVLASKDAAMRSLKEAISRALLDFEGKGLTVEQRDGKVYVSMENKLLFDSGSWSVNATGRRAVMQLAGVLAANPGISVLIEGHTDDVPYAGNGPLEDNWDLSVKRATTIVKILTNHSDIDPGNLTAAGKGRYVPVADNSTEGGRARNRRIEIVLAPKLDEVSKLLSEI